MLVYKQVEVQTTEQKIIKIQILCSHFLLHGRTCPQRLSVFCETFGHNTTQNTRVKAWVLIHVLSGSSSVSLGKSLPLG